MPSEISNGSLSRKSIHALAIILIAIGAFLLFWPTWWMFTSHVQYRLNPVENKELMRFVLEDVQDARHSVQMVFSLQRVLSFKRDPCFSKIKEVFNQKSGGNNEGSIEIALMLHTLENWEKKPEDCEGGELDLADSIRELFGSEAEVLLIREEVKKEAISEFYIIDDSKVLALLPDEDNYGNRTTFVHIKNRYDTIKRFSERFAVNRKSADRLL